MYSGVVTHRRELALVQHERVLKEADFVAQLARQARNRAAVAPVHPDAARHSHEVRARVEYQLTAN